MDGEKRALWFAGGDFEPKVGGTASFTFDHSKVSDEPVPKAAYGSGWHTYLDALEDRLRNVKPRPFWTNFAKRQAEYAERFP